MTKTVRPYHLTPSEETIMQILWESKGHSVLESSLCLFLTEQPHWEETD